MQETQYTWENLEEELQVEGWPQVTMPRDGTLEPDLSAPVEILICPACDYRSVVKAARYNTFNNRNKPFRCWLWRLHCPICGQRATRVKAWRPLASSSTSALPYADNGA